MAAGGLGTLLRTLRQGRGKSLRQIADPAHITVNALWNLEKGVTVNPSVKTLAALSKPLRVDPVELFRAAVE